MQSTEENEICKYQRDWQKSDSCHVGFLFGFVLFGGRVKCTLLGFVTP